MPIKQTPLSFLFLAFGFLSLREDGDRLLGQQVANAEEVLMGRAGQVSMAPEPLFLHLPNCPELVSKEKKKQKLPTCFPDVAQLLFFVFVFEENAWSTMRMVLM